MTEDEILNCTNGQALADAVAVEVMGWHKIESQKPPYEVFQTSQAKWVKDWQPHKPTEKGKAQCWDLMVKCKVAFAYDYRIKAFLVSNGCGFSVLVDKENLQITILKACLLSQLGED